MGSGETLRARRPVAALGLEKHTELIDERYGRLVLQFAEQSLTILHGGNHAVEQRAEDVVHERRIR